MVMSKTAWDSLDPAEQKAFTEAARAAGQVSREAAGRAEREGVDELRKAGMNVVASVDRAAFEQSLQSVTAGFSAKFGAETIRQIKSIR